MYFQKLYCISNLYYNENEITLRVVTDTSPTKYKTRKARPTLEDLYLFVCEKENKIRRNLYYGKIIMRKTPIRTKGKNIY